MSKPPKKKTPNKKTPDQDARTTSEPRSPKRRDSRSPRPSGALGTGRYEPRDLGELMRYCKIVIQSDLCPRHIKSPADAMLIIQRGAELGLSAVNALQNLNVINGKVTMPATLAVGVVKASDACEYFTSIESTGEFSTWETKRRGNPESTRYTFSKHDAQVAGLWGSGTWRKYPRNLLAARASMNLARMEYQDVLVGVYTPEEIESIDEPAARAEPHPEPAKPSSPARRDTDDQWPVDLAEESVPEPDQTRPPHWSEEPIEERRDRSRTKKWQKQNERFHALMRTGDVEQHCDAFREFIKARHQVGSWTQITAEVLARWCDVIGKRSADEDGDEESARASWVEQKLARHAHRSRDA